jgi:DNA invertase Pin-like site-specific DNA recombinase
MDGKVTSGIHQRRDPELRRRFAATTDGDSTAPSRECCLASPRHERMDASGESASTIAATLGVSRATVYRVLAQEAGSSDTSP